MKKASDEEGILKGSTKTSLFQGLKKKENNKNSNNPNESTNHAKESASPSSLVAKSNVSNRVLVSKKALISMLAGFLLIGASVFAYFYFTKKPVEVTDSGYQYEVYLDNAKQLSTKGKYGEAEGLLEYMLTKETHTGRRIEIYRNIGLAQVNGKKYDEAIQSFREVEKLEGEPSTATISAIAITAEQMGDKQLAIEYYQKRIEKLDTSSPIYEDTKLDYEGKIQELSQ